MTEKKTKIVTRRKVESVRERAEKQRRKKDKAPRRRKVTSAAAKPAQGIREVLGREYHLVKLPDSKAGRVLTKRRRWIPGFFRKSFEELKLVTWPTPKQAASLSFAVVLFSVTLAGLIRLLDYGFERLFKEVILK